MMRHSAPRIHVMILSVDASMENITVKVPVAKAVDGR
jgi:hypothetical protein